MKNAREKVNTLILSIYRDLAEGFVESIIPDQKAEVIIGDFAVTFNIVAGDPGQESAFEEQVSNADAMAVVVRFLDVLSLDKIRNIYRHLPNDINLPMAVFLLRDKGEMDFKISCPSCGQKLWLRDTDIGKRGRCPNCKKPFVILSQADHLRAQLMLPESVPIVKVVQGDLESFRTALGQLLASLATGIKPADAALKIEALNSATVPIQIQDN